MKKYLLSLIVIFALVLSACSTGSSNNENSSNNKKENDSKTVKVKNSFESRDEEKDDESKKVNEDVEVPLNPEKAVVFDYATLETMKELGVKDKVKGVAQGEKASQVPEFLKEFRDKKYTNVGGPKQPNYKNVAKVDPDVIYIAGRTSSQQMLNELKKAAPNAKIVYVGPDENESVKSMKKVTENIGKIYNKKDEADKINQKLDKKIKSMKKETKSLDEKAMYLLVNEGELSTFGPGERFGSLVYDTLGFKPVDTNIKNSTHGENISYEYVNKQDPDLIFAMDRGQAIGGKSTVKQVLSNDVIKDVNAIKNDDIIELKADLWYKSAGSSATTIKQIDDLKEGLDEKQ